MNFNHATVYFQILLGFILEGFSAPLKYHCHFIYLFILSFPVVILECGN